MLHVYLRQRSMMAYSAIAGLLVIVSNMWLAGTKVASGLHVKGCWLNA